MSSPIATEHRYDEAWACAEERDRLAILEEIWAADGLYVDPDIPEGLRGPAALAAFIGQSFEELPGLAITAASELAVLGDRGWYRWGATTNDGQSFSGIDFVEFDPDGRIARVSNFYDG
jgi:hypothetical protein